MASNPYDQIDDFLFLGNRHALNSASIFSLIVNCSREEDVAFPQIACIACVCPSPIVQMKAVNYLI